MLKNGVSWIWVYIGLSTLSLFHLSAIIHLLPLSNRVRADGRAGYINVAVKQAESDN